MVFHQPAEIISTDHRAVSKVKLIHFDGENNILYSLIPRNLNGLPLPFSTNEVYNIVYTSYEEIHFFKVQFTRLDHFNDEPVYNFSVLDYQKVKNVRKEERKSVEYQAVVSDFNEVGHVLILDISYSGMKIESDYEIKSEFIEIFFDEENVPRRALGQICWSKYDQETKQYYYGVEIRYR